MSEPTRDQAARDVTAAEDAAGPPRDAGEASVVAGAPLPAADAAAERDADAAPAASVPVEREAEPGPEPARHVDSTPTTDATAPDAGPPSPAPTGVLEVTTARDAVDGAAGGVARFEVLTVEDFARRSQPLADRRAGPDTERAAPPRAARATADQSRADLRRRVLARLIDVAIFALLSESVTYLGPLVALIYLLLGDGLLDGASVGKRLARLRVLRARDGKPASVFDSLLRNAPLGIAGLFVLIPLVGWALFVTLGLVVVLFEGYLVFTDPRGVRAGDILAGTQVHEAGPALPGGAPPAAGGGPLPA